MQSPTAYYRESGAGPSVVCIHSNASSSSQWRPLMDRLSDRYRVIAVDTYAAGKSPEWPQGCEGTLTDETAFLEGVFRAAGDSFHLAGHSYGAAVALKAALENPSRVTSLILYEPSLFSLLLAENARHPGARDIREVTDDSIAAIHRGDHDAAARRFIDYWMGAGTWAAMPESRRIGIAKSMRGMAQWTHALFHEPTPLAAFAALDVPVLYLTGSTSPRCARDVAGLLTKSLPRVTVAELHGLGHMGPVTHPDIVNEAIEQHLERMGESPHGQSHSV